MRRAVCSAMGVAMVAFGFVCATPAHAAPTCQGREATIVDTDGGEVQGTAGDDVIHASGLDSIVSAYDGNDLVCLEDGQVFAGPGRDSVQARGADGIQGIGVWHGEDLDIALGGDRDFVGLYFTGAGSGRIDGGPGGGQFSVHVDSSVDVDLEDATVEIGDGTGSYHLTGFHDVGATAPRVRVEGDRHDNQVTVTRVACEITIEGGRGHDELALTGNADDLPELDCDREPTPRLYGQRGNDRMQGRGDDDVLVGGRGRDVAKGSFGFDTCRAERERSCER